MSWLDRLEGRLHWLAFPGLFKYLALTGVVVNAWGWLDPSGPATLAFDLAKILEGEVWRVFSFALTPTGLFGFDSLGINVLLLYFMTRIAFLISDSLEDAWGTTRTTLYILTVCVGLVVGQSLILVPFPSTGLIIELSLFLAFATLYPKHEFLMFLVLPVQVRWLALASLAISLHGVYKAPLTFLLLLPALIPYAIWVLPDFVRNRKGLVEAAARRKKFEAASAPDDAFHRCKVCERTERDDDELEFRTYPDGSEYCVDHLPDEGVA